MNVEVKAGPLSLSTKAELVDVSIMTQITVVKSLALPTTWSCFASIPLSINGHSLNAINPDILVGGMAAS